MILLEFKSIGNAKKLTGLSYLGGVSLSQKHLKAETYNEHTYTIYLAPANSSGYEVCPGRTAECTALCLNMSGRNKIGSYTSDNKVEKARLKKTRLFFEQREFFTRWLIADIKAAKRKADKLGFRFSVRLNNTSDISPEQFYIVENGKKLNVLELFPDIQFYDYTKVGTRAALTKKYANYDLTYSFSGENMDRCVGMLETGIRVAAVFYPVLPDEFLGKKVIDGDLYDMRYLDANDVIVGLKYKKVRNQLTVDNKFVIQNETK